MNHDKEQVEMTVLCMICQNNNILIQNRMKSDWRGYTFPGGHINKNEPIVAALKREIKEETGLDIYEPKLSGIEHFYRSDGTLYLIFYFIATSFSGNLKSSKEGEMLWVSRENLDKHKLVRNFFDILRLFDDETLTELTYSSDKCTNPSYF